MRLSTAAGEATLPLLRAYGVQVAAAQVQRHGSLVFDVSAPFASLSPTRDSPPATSYSPTDNPADLLYATFLGGSGDDSGYGIAVDAAGYAYVTGYTQSDDFPTTPGAFDTSGNGWYDVFVAKLNPAGSRLAYATFLGGSGDDSGYGIAVDGAGSAYVTGKTYSTDFPITPGAVDTSYNSVYDAFVVKLNPAGSGLAYATYLGGCTGDIGRGIALDEAGSAYVTGKTSGCFPTTPGAFDTSYNNAHNRAFVAKLNPTGSGLAYATYLGGTRTYEAFYSDDYGWGIAVDEAGHAYVTGQTDASDFPTTPGAFDTSFDSAYGGPFVAKLNPTGSGLTYATYWADRGGLASVSRWTVRATPT